jgi:hypothetical protein
MRHGYVCVSTYHSFVVDVIPWIHQEPIQHLGLEQVYYYYY